MRDIQDLFDSVSDSVRAERSGYHLTLGELRDALSDVDDQSKPVVFDRGDGVRSPSEPHSYRGHYSDLAFKPFNGERSVANVLSDVVDTIGEMLEGYKGGMYEMGEDTPLWASTWGHTSQVAIMGVDEEDDAVVLQTKKID